MKERLVSIRELSNILNIKEPTFRTYIDNYRFSKFITRAKIEHQNNRVKLVIKLNKQFAYKLCDFLRAKNKPEAIERLIEYFEGLENGNK